MSTTPTHTPYTPDPDRVRDAACDLMDAAQLALLACERLEHDAAGRVLRRPRGDAEARRKMQQAQRLAAAGRTVAGDLEAIGHTAFDVADRIASNQDLSRADFLRLMRARGEAEETTRAAVALAYFLDEDGAASRPADMMRCAARRGTAAARRIYRAEEEADPLTVAHRGTVNDPSAVVAQILALPPVDRPGGDGAASPPPSRPA
jgi:broad specificity phosphatase PhoE